jgi:hypothetical protein
MNLQAALWAAQELAARRAFAAALEADRQRKRNPRLERYRNLNAIYAHTLERDEKENSES